MAFFFIVLFLLCLVVSTSTMSHVLDVEGQYYVTYAGETKLTACTKEGISQGNVASIVVAIDYEQWDLIKKKVFITREEKLDHMRILYGFDDSLIDYYYLDGEKTNLQIVLKETQVLIGYPIIFAGF